MITFELIKQLQEFNSRLMELMSENSKLIAKLLTESLTQKLN